MHASMQEVLENIEVNKLPSFPHVLVKLLEACQRPDASLGALAKLIDKDTGLSAKVISAANSPLYGLRNPVLSLERTLVVLGLDTIKTITIASAVHQFFSSLSADRGAFLKAFWHHSLLCATLARNLARLTGYPAREEAYLAGLLHDVGKLVLAQRFPDKYGAVQALAEENRDLVDQEREHFGVAHHEVGFWLIRNWQLDSFMADAVLYHHEASDRLLESHPLVRVIHVANQLAVGGEGGQEAAQQLFGLNFELSAEQYRDAAEEVRTVAQSLDIDVEPAESYERRQAVQARDAAVHDRLAAEVRNIGLLDGVRQQLGGVGAADLMRAVRDSVRLVTEVHRPLVFILQENGTRLAGEPTGEDDTLVAQLTVPTTSTESLVARCARERMLLSSVNAEGERSVLDREILALSQQEHMLCVPLWDVHGVIGVLVLGAGAARIERLQTQSQLLESLAQEIGRTLQTSRLRDQERRVAEDECRAEFELRARALAHEANNPLSIMQNYLHLLSSKLEQGHDAQGDLEIIREEVQRVSTMLRHMAAPEEDAGQERRLDINAAVADLVKVFQRSLFEPAGIEASTDLDPDLPPLAHSRSAFKQVLVNLLKNAAESLSQGGVISVISRDRVNFNGAQFVEVSVQDNGPGIPAPVLERLFQPVQTTKGAGHAGLGLTIVNNLVKEMGGVISCGSDHTGTRFQILLPRAVAQSE